MKKTFFVWTKIMAIAIMVLGCIHLAATPFIMAGLKSLSSEFRLTFLFMFVAAGLGTILPGIVILSQHAGLLAFQKKAWRLCFICACYVLLYGLLAVITMINNPFAYICLLFGILVFIPLIKNKASFTN